MLNAGKINWLLVIRIYQGKEGFLDKLHPASF